MSKVKKGSINNLRYIFLFVVVVFGLITIVGTGCGGGGDGGGGGSDGGGDGGGGGSAGPAPGLPTLSAVDLSPSSVEAGTRVTIQGSFDFNDSDGDLDGGEFKYTYENATYTITLPASLAGMTNGTVSFQLVADCSSNIGDISIPCWLVDKAGHESNNFDVILNQFRIILFGTSIEDRGFAVAAGSSDNIYITGYTKGDLDGNIYNGGGSDMFLTKFDSSGVKQWTRLLGSNDSDIGYCVAVDSNDYVYVTGYTKGDLDGNINNGICNMFLTKFDSSGVKQWTRLLGSNYCSSGKGVAVDGNDYVYVTGYTEGDLDGNIYNGGGSDMFLTKFDSSGVKQWTRLLGSGGRGVGVAVDSNDYVYVTGYTFGDLDGNINNGGYDMFLTKFDSSGVKQWTRLLGSNYFDVAGGVAVDGNDYVYVTGSTKEDLDGNINNGIIDMFLTKFDSSGVKQWTKLWGTSGADYGHGVAVDGNDYVYVTGDTKGDLDGYDRQWVLQFCNLDKYELIKDIFLTKFDSSGVIQWTRLLGSLCDESGNGVAVDGNDHVYVTGDTNGDLGGKMNQGGDDCFLLQM